MTPLADTTVGGDDTGTSGSSVLSLPDAGRAASPFNEATTACFHCGTPCRDARHRCAEKVFCCQGCLTVFELLTENGLDEFYRLGESAGRRIRAGAGTERFRFVDEPEVRERLVDFSDTRLTRVTFQIPAIHCIACVWLLENLFRLKPGLGHSQVNFPRKEVTVSFATVELKLSDVVELLASLGYEPELKLSDLDSRPRQHAAHKLWVQLGVAGFAFGNVMLFSIAGYFGLDAFSGRAFKTMVGLLSFALATAVVIYSARDYWRSAWTSVSQRLLNIDVPIAAGIAAIYFQSSYEVFTGRGDGFFDTLCGLTFSLLCGRMFQQKTYERLAFDRDYRSFFPLSVTRVRSDRREEATPSQSEIRNPKSEIEECVSLNQLQVGDQLLIRNGELIPADAELIAGPALIDYSFVTGESEPVAKHTGDHLYAGGRQIGGAIEVEMVKAVSQSYLTSLWNQDAFQKGKEDWFDRLTNQYSQRFTKIVIAVAVGAALFWLWANPAVSLRAFASVLIVACPCALALAAPFALGTAQRVLARHSIFLKNPHVIETLARVNTVVFDKTGTLTAAGAGSVSFRGPPLNETEERWLYSMTRHSTHPYAVRVGEAIARGHFPEPVRSFLETPGCGMEGSVVGHEIWMGSAAWLGRRGVNVEQASSRFLGSNESPDGVKASRQDACSALASSVHVAINGQYRGCFVLASALRPELEKLVGNLAGTHELALLSGDNPKERERFRFLFGPTATLNFNQSPLDKLEFVHGLQRSGKTVMMVGDGLNDAGALKQSDVGVAVVENVSAFSPASDVIAAAAMVPQLAEVLHFAKLSVRVVHASFVISAIYNVLGIAIAASGHLSPVVCAILMPLSSVTVVGFACGVTAWLGRRALRDGHSPMSDWQGNAPQPDLTPTFGDSSNAQVQP